MEVALSLLTACLNASELKEQVKFFIFYPDCSVLCGIVLFRGVIYILCQKKRQSKSYEFHIKLRGEKDLSSRVILHELICGSTPWGLKLNTNLINSWSDNLIEGTADFALVFSPLYLIF